MPRPAPALPALPARAVALAMALALLAPLPAPAQSGGAGATGTGEETAEGTGEGTGETAGTERAAPTDPEAGSAPETAPPAPPRDDERTGYYYPEVGSEEIFRRSIAQPISAASRDLRVGFVTQLTKAQLEAPANPRFVIFAKGAQAEHMIIVALDDEIFATLYRARAQLAQLTANARDTEFFIENGLASVATWFDLAKLLGFEDIVLSDGRTWAHRVVLIP